LEATYAKGIYLHRVFIAYLLVITHYLTNSNSIFFHRQKALELKVLVDYKLYIRLSNGEQMCLWNWRGIIIFLFLEKQLKHCFLCRNRIVSILVRHG